MGHRWCVAAASQRIDEPFGWMLRLHRFIVDTNK
jgi:hypothetical protein